MMKTAIILSLVHLIYYAYFQAGSDIIRIIRSRNIPPNETVLRFMTDYDINIRMFNYNGKPYGFAWFRTIYLNTHLEGLRMRNKGDREWPLKWAFHHEYYHVRNKHKAKILLMRLFFSFVPLLLIVHWIPFVVVYVIYAYGMKVVHDRFEDGANNHANEIMNERNNQE